MYNESKSELPSKRDLRKKYLRELLKSWWTWGLILTIILLVGLIALSVFFSDFIFALIGISSNMLMLLFFSFGTQNIREKHKELIKFKRKPWMGTHQSDKSWVQKFRYSI